MKPFIATHWSHGQCKSTPHRQTLQYSRPQASNCLNDVKLCATSKFDKMCDTCDTCDTCDMTKFEKSNDSNTSNVLCFALLRASLPLWSSWPGNNWHFLFRTQSRHLGLVRDVQELQPAAVHDGLGQLGQLRKGPCWTPMGLPLKWMHCWRTSRFSTVPTKSSSLTLLLANMPRQETCGTALPGACDENTRQMPPEPRGDEMTWTVPQRSQLWTETSPNKMHCIVRNLDFLPR